MAPPSKGRDMTRGPLGRSLFAVAWPVMLSFLLMAFYNLADTFWLGKLGKSALVAPTVSMNIFFVCLSLAMGLGMGGTTLVSQYRGAGRLRSMRRAGGQTLVLLGVAGAFVAVVGLLVAVPLLRLLQTPEDAFGGTLAYLRWILIGMPFMFTFFVYQGISLGMGDTIGPLKINAVTMAANALLDPFLIFGWGPFPELGVVGAGLATCIARSIAGGLGVYRLFRGEHGFKLYLGDLRINAGMMVRMLRIGMPLSLGQTGTSLGFTLLLGIVNSFGSAVTAAFGIGHRVIMLAMIPGFGFSQASATAVGQNLGAEQPQRAMEAVKYSCRTIAMILLPVTTLMFLFGDQIGRIFIDDPEVIGYARDVFRVTSFSVFVFGFIMVLLGAFQGAGHTVPVMVLNMSRLWLIRIPAAYLLAIVLGMGPLGLWWAMFLSNILTAVAAAIWFSFGTWKRRVIEDVPAAEDEEEAVEAPPPLPLNG